MTTLVDSGDLTPFDCAETVRRLWDYLDHELTDAEVRAVDAHLAQCERCPQHFEFERAFLAAVRSARAEQGAHAALHDRVRAILQLEARHG
jgi:anti-sigma factor (TIGR02949 family)